MTVAKKYPVTVPFGVLKGKLFSEVTDDEIAYLATIFEKEPYHTAAIEEVGKRGLMALFAKKMAKKRKADAKATVGSVAEADEAAEARETAGAIMVSALAARANVKRKEDEKRALNAITRLEAADADGTAEALVPGMAKCPNCSCILRLEIAEGN